LVRRQSGTVDASNAAEPADDSERRNASQGGRLGRRGATLGSCHTMGWSGGALYHRALPITDSPNGAGSFDAINSTVFADEPKNDRFPQLRQIARC
jgi:hypothetical protein